MNQTSKLLTTVNLAYLQFISLGSKPMANEHGRFPLSRPMYLHLIALACAPIYLTTYPAFPLWKVCLSAAGANRVGWSSCPETAWSQWCWDKDGSKVQLCLGPLMSMDGSKSPSPTLCCKILIKKHSITYIIIYAYLIYVQIDKYNR